MEFALILLGLLPLAFLPALQGPADDDEADPPGEGFSGAGTGALPDAAGAEGSAAGGDDGLSDDLLSDEGDFDAGDFDEGVPPGGDPGDTGAGKATQGTMPGEGDAGSVLAPHIEDDVPGPPGEDPQGVLLPEADAPDQGGGGVPFTPEEVLLPVDEFDSEGHGVWLDLTSDAGIGHAEIAGFRPGEDMLRITLPPRDDGTAPELTVGRSEDGQDGMVFIDGDLVAILIGAADLSASDVDIVQP